MTCSTCHKPAHDNAVAYYTVEAPGFYQFVGTGRKLQPQHIVKCWTCLTPTEKTERDPGYSDRVRFELIKSLRTK